MHSIRRTLLIRTFELFDVVALSFAAIVAKAAADPGFRTVPASIPALLDRAVTMRGAVMVAVLLLSWHGLLTARELYASRRLSTFRAEVRDVVLSTLSATAATAAVVWLFARVDLTPVFLALFLGISLAVLLASRVALRVLLRRVRLRGRNLRHVVIVGTNRNAQEYAAQLRSRPELGYIIAGFVDEPAAAEGLDSSSDPFASDFDHFPEYLRSHVVDEVAVFVPIKSFYSRMRHVVAACEEQGIIVRIRSDMFDLPLGNLQVEEAPGMSLPLVTIYTGRMRGWRMALKRLIDVVGAWVLLVIVSPLLAAAALAIRFSSGSPVLFGQERVGLNKRRFRLYKFRTMVPNAEKLQGGLARLNEVAGPVFKIRNDPRITPLGRFLRRSSIDELPQLWNVLKGDMSLVGPRPLPIRDYEGFSENAHRRRFSVRPGLTCLWQVSGRNDIPFERWMQLDMQYIDSWSLRLDLIILAKTVPAVLRATGT